MLRGKKETRAGQTLKIGHLAIDCDLVDKNFEVMNLKRFHDKTICLYTFPSVEIKKCLANLKRLNELASQHSNIHFLCVSLDIPFTLNRVITGYNLKNIYGFSDFRTREFGFAYGVLILDGLLAGMLADSFTIINENKLVTYSQQLEHLERDLNWQEIEHAILS